MNSSKYENHVLKLLSFSSTLLIVLLCFGQVSAQFTVRDHQPSSSSTQGASDQAISITFSQEVREASLDDGLYVHGSVSGRINGTFSLTSPISAEFIPDREFAQGERISVTVTGEVQAINGAFLEDSYQWQFSVRPALGGYEFTEPDSYTLTSGSEPSAIKAVRLSDLQTPDLVVVNANNSLVTVFRNRTQTIYNDFAIADEIETGIETVNKAATEDALLSLSLPVNSSITAADLTNDGNTDIAIAATLSNQLILLDNRSADPQNLELRLVDTGERPVEVIKGDFNNNGWIDLAVAAIGSDQIYIHYNDGNGNFDSYETFSVGLAPNSISAEDVNANGRLDIIISVSGDNRIEVLENQGDGTFVSNVVAEDLSFTPSFLVTGNFLHSDGQENYPDFVVGSSDERTFYIYENDGGEFTFNASWNAGTSSRPLFATAADMDSDGLLELVSTHMASDDLAINEFTETGAIGSRVIIDHEIDSPLGVTAADLNLGGSIDIAVTNRNSNRISLYFNALDADVCEERMSDFSLPETVDFGDVELNNTATQTFIIENNSGLSLNTTIDVADGHFFELESTSEFFFPSGTSRYVEVSFLPDEIEEYSDQLIVQVNSKCGLKTYEVNLEGNGIDPLPDLIAKDLNIVSHDISGGIRTGISYVFEGKFILEGKQEVTDPFNVALYVNDERVEQERITSDIQLGAEISSAFTYEFQEAGDYHITYVVDADDEIQEIDATNNTATMQISIRMPDLVATNIMAVDTPSIYILEEEYEFRGTFRLDGDVTIDDSFSISFEVDNTTIETIRLDEQIEPGQTRSFNFTYRFEEARQKQITFVVDPDNVIEESDITNNTATMQISVEMPDLVARNITAVQAPSIYLVGEEYEFNGTLRLDGGVTINDPFNISFEVDNITKETIRVDEQIEPGQTRSFSFEHLFEEARRKEVTFVVDPDNEIKESNVINNRISMHVTIEEGEVSVRPNPFTPNNNGYNDYVEFDFSQFDAISNLVIRIFSMDGGLVQSIKEQNFSGSFIKWDGTDSSGDVMMPGVYLYVIEGGDGLLKRGSITLAL